ncbi:uncharacterized protein TM35_000521390 [Trypanosoma theileri]|uniref:Uncharacterized protein n=1 Tax=Trypanosoma theileri TaxID=67003 RepID=A0A1X0NH00_9TRYP|nr:uncharacterized protein TM35_000521390 [Trypanosoma theileri]ORC83995.1 hypothetical protein TM35_000521390 [Trypanosoma theileri]
MTTMLKQMRRIVYLLVLLQCCVCVAFAEESSSNGVSEAERLPKEWVNKAREMLNLAYNVTAGGEGCLNVWERVVKENEETVSRAHDGVKNITDLVKEIRVKMISDYPEDGSRDKEIMLNMTEEDFSVEDAIELLKKMEKALEGNEPPVASAEALEKMDRATHVCVNALNSIEDAERGIEGVLPEFHGFREDVEKITTLKDLETDCKEALKRLSDVKEQLELQKLNATHALEKAKGQVSGWENAMTTLINLGNFTPEEALKVTKIEHHVESRQPVSENMKVEIRNSLSNIKNKSEAEKEKMCGKENVTTTERREKAVEEIDKEVAEEFKSATERIEKERRLAAEEKARRAAEEKAKNDKKKEDNSVRPSLMHSPLLLLLLCVLGCTLVC